MLDFANLFLPTHFLPYVLAVIVWHLSYPSHALHDLLPRHSKCQSNYQSLTNNTGQVPPMPRLPQQYSMLVDAKVVHDGWGYLMEEHYDDINQRAAVTVTFNATTTHTIFNFDPQERCDIHPDGSCIVSREKPDLHTFLFVVDTESNTPLPARACPHHVFQLAEDEDVTYVGQTWLAGVPVDHWTSCMEWAAFQAKWQLDFYFTSTDYLDTWGQVQRPVRVEINGTSGHFSSDELPMNHDFHHIYDYTSFHAASVQDEGVFQIPTNVVCQGRTQAKPMPELTDQFQMDMEITSPYLGNSLPIQQSLRYDWSNRMMEIVREFPVPQGIPGNIFRNKEVQTFTKRTRSKEPSDWIAKWTVSWVEDYHTGLQYITQKNNNTCRVRELPETDMSPGDALLRIAKHQNDDGENKFTYQGKSIFRDLPSESWGMEADGMMQKVFFLTPTKGKDRPVDKEGLTPEELKKLQIGMNRIRLAPFPQFPVLLGILVRNHSAIDSRNMPSLVKQLFSESVFHWVQGRYKLFNYWNETDEDEIVLQKYVSWTRLQESNHEHVGELDIRVYNYQPLHTDPDMFHVSQCYSPDQISKVSLIVRTSYVTNVHHDPTTFSIAMRKGLAKAMGVSTLQISDLTPSASKDDSRTIVTFNLLGSPPVAEPRHRQADLMAAKQSLKVAIGRGITFSVKYASGTRSFIVDKDVLVLDSNLEESVVIQHINKLSGASGDGNKASGLTSGVMAGAVIASMAVTCGLTVLVMVIFLKTRRRSDFPSIPYSSVKEQDNNNY